VTGKMRGNGRSTERGSWFNFSLPDDYETITTKEVELIVSKSKYVKNYTISANLAAEAVDFSYYKPSGDDNSNTTDTRSPFTSIRSAANINIVGVDTKDKETNFNSDNSTIVDGRYFTDDEINNASKVIIIEKTIADLNDIAVGDSIKIERMATRLLGTISEGKLPTAEITYQVIGIYKTSNPTDINNSSFMGTF
jgi:hypothetical protein